MPALLTEPEMVQLTGARRSHKQAEVLRRHGIRFIERRDGAIATTWEAVNAVLAPQAAAPTRKGPDFSVLEREIHRQAGNQAG